MNINNLAYSPKGEEDKMNRILSIMEVRQDGSRNSLSIGEQDRAIAEFHRLYGDRQFSCEIISVEILNDFRRLIVVEIAFDRNNTGFEPEFPLF